MNREIKFRGKKLDDEKWVYGSLLSDPYRGDTEISDHDDINLGRYDVDPDTVGQFTGLKDKNGKEVFEDDIVRWEKDNWLYVVVFHRGMFYASVEQMNEGVYGGYPLWVLCEEECPCTIVGNIHDTNIEEYERN